MSAGVSQGGPQPVAERISLAALRRLWANRAGDLPWPCLFTLPAWLEAWSATRGRGTTSYLWAVRQGDSILAVAPLRRDGERAGFLGDPDVCDYQDLILAPGTETAAVAAMCRAWRADGVRQLRLDCVRPESHVLHHLLPWAADHGAEVERTPAGVALELVLAPTWDGYLASLPKKQRHELRRKLRRLHEAGTVSFCSCRGGEGLPRQEEVFLRLFRANRADKSRFMDPAMEQYFRALLTATAADGLLCLGLLTLDGEAVAATLSFDYGGRTHLYNNGYLQQRQGLSVGLLSKVFDLQRALQAGAATYDLLKGDEAYKFRLGATPVALQRACVRWPESSSRGKGVAPPEGVPGT